MSDYHDYDYYPVRGYSNVYRRITKGEKPDPRFSYVVAPSVQPLVDALCQQRPHWKFIGENLNSRVAGEDYTFTINQYHVYEGEEQIGQISTSTKYREGEATLVFQYDTERLRRNRQRGAWTVTAKLDAAIKGALKHFTSKTLTEVISNRMHEVNRALSVTESRAMMEFTRKFSDIHSKTSRLIMDNWEAIVPMLKRMGATVPEDLPELYERRNHLRTLEMSFTTGQGVMVYTRPNDYVVVRKQDEDAEVNIIAPDVLPAHYKRGLGLLKLVEVGDWIPNVGQRCLADTYFILDEEASNG